jgi:hypothetical protein
MVEARVVGDLHHARYPSVVSTDVWEIAMRIRTQSSHKGILEGVSVMAVKQRLYTENNDDQRREPVRAAGGEVARCRVHGGVGASGQRNQAIGTFEWRLPGRY